MIGITKLKVDEETGEISTCELSWKDFYKTPEEGERDWKRFKETGMKPWEENNCEFLFQENHEEN